MSSALNPAERRRIRNAKKAYVSGTVFEIVGWLTGLTCLSVGIYLVRKSEKVLEYNKFLEKWQDTDRIRHPYVAEGWITLSGGIICASLIIMMAAFVKTKVSDEMNSGGVWGV
jgi:hypothetical protein